MVTHFFVVKNVIRHVFWCIFCNPCGLLHIKEFRRWSYVPDCNRKTILSAYEQDFSNYAIEELKTWSE